MTNWIAGAAKDGHLDVAVYGTSDNDLKEKIISVMDGHTYGPELPLILAEDHSKGARIVVLLNPDVFDYSDALCTNPQDGFSTGKSDKVAFALCYNELSYGYVIATSLIENMQAETEEFAEFFANATRILTDPRYEIENTRSNCSESGNC